MASASDVYVQALALPETQRAELARQLLASLGPSADLGDEAWLQEIAQRAESVTSGASPGIPWEDVYAEAKQRLKK